MALELVWSCSGSVSGEMVNMVNPRGNTSADAINGPAWNLWKMKECLKEVGWTVVSSSDSQTTSSSDLWGSTFDETLRSSKNSKIFYNTTNSAHSWIVLAAPTGSDAAGHYLIMDYVSGDLTTPSNKAQFVITKGPIGGGSTTAKPTGSADFGIHSSNSAATAQYMAFFDDYTNNTAQHRLNFHYTSDGAFMFTEAQVGKGRFTFLLSFVPLQNTHAADNYKWILAGFDSYNNASGYTPFSNFGGAAPFWYESSGAITGRSHNGAVALNMAGIVPVIAPEGGAVNVNGIVFSAILTAPNASDTTYSDFPIVVVNTANGPGEMKGRIPDITWTSTSIPNGAAAPPKATAASSYERVKHIMMWIPWVTSQSPVL